jgi:anti-sigma B factor antagonist
MMQVRDFIDSDGLPIVAITGDVDLHHSADLRAVLNQHAEAKCPVLLVDVTEVEYMDSAGIATLVEYMQQAIKYRGRFAVGGANERLRTIFDIVRLGEIFTVRPTAAEAKAALQA